MNRAHGWPRGVIAGAAGQLGESAPDSSTAAAFSAVRRSAVLAAMRAAPRGSALSPSGLRAEHILALDAEGQDKLVGLVCLLVDPEGVRRLPPLAAQALAGAELLHLTKPGSVDADELSRLRPIGMPELYRKLAAGALASTVRDAAAQLFSPLQLGVGISSP